MSKELITKARRGEIYLAWFSKKSVGTEIRKTRPVLIISSNWQNEVSKRIIVLPLSTKVAKIYDPAELYIGKISGEEEESKIMCDQIKSIDKKRLIKKLASLSDDLMIEVVERLKELLEIY